MVIDTEADFDWDRGISTDVGRVVSISGLDENFDSFRKHGIRPSLVIDHPVATHAEGGRIVRRLAEEGCEIGVHLHSWTTPPMVEPRDDWHSFSGNMGAWLERRKLATLTHRVEALTGRKARIFKAGRYGLGPNTVDALEAEGFEIDLSICPWYDYSALGGPDFSRFTARPGWFGASRRLLSLPTTAAPLGWLGPQAHLVTRVTRGGLGRQLGLGRIAARANAFYPLRLSPEGADLGQMIQVTRQLHARGLRVFTLSLHSPTLQVGNTPMSAPWPTFVNCSAGSTATAPSSGTSWAASSPTLPTCTVG
ncbi:glycosyltransferase [Siccirubricoccus deserti]